MGRRGMDGTWRRRWVGLETEGRACVKVITIKIFIDMLLHRYVSCCMPR